VTRKFPGFPPSNPTLLRKSKKSENDLIYLFLSDLFYFYLSFFLFNIKFQLSTKVKPKNQSVYTTDGTDRNTQQKGCQKNSYTWLILANSEYCFRFSRVDNSPTEKFNEVQKVQM
jgi:hypothetical protein